MSVAYAQCEFVNVNVLTFFKAIAFWSLETYLPNFKFFILSKLMSKAVTSNILEEAIASGKTT